MKRKSVVYFLIAGFLSLLFPLKAFAKEPVTIYFFRGETCSHCAKAESFFETLKEDDEYKDLFIIKDYEVWNNDDNADFMDEVADVMGDTVSGVPYIIIGDESWNGYASSYDEDLKAKIKEVYEDESFADPLATIASNYDAGITKDDNNSLLTVGILIVLGGVIGAGLYFARRGVDSEEELDEKLEAKKEEPKKEESKKTETPKKPAKKKTTSTKKKKV